ncbi:MAG: prephenate dehydrogenase [Gammaproteobacteria bacterium]|nr:prephenate dehydrogenase [Gammaproteobacteria bacterium]MBT4461883.1 prephenate dehydrogenase [Gammaproteobacteria bacterium]MBT4654272.1 prephenate dehydrogenase [Gammaproteobacteria bacterium]MBT5116945.1 prephenate dehydrogenase [Gammaproteobacteria bacterium]MBT5761177.1 prephenate dehydrogenase [Gammaproteobacteria bacterium]
MYNSIYIFGLGMMGASLASSIKRKKLAKKIFAYDTDVSSLKYAKNKKIINNFDSDDFKYLSESDFIIICVPMSAYKKIFTIINKHKSPNAIITDIGSTKENIIAIAESTLSNNSDCFIGSHPLTGKETSKIISYEENLFDKAVVLMTPTRKKNKALINKVSKFWKSLKCQVKSISPQLHDLVLSETSHLPHLVSFALVNIILNTKSIKNIKDYTGGGFRDFARLAHSDGRMWNDICRTNEKNIISSINLLIKELGSIKKIIKNNDNSLHQYLNGIKTKLDKK